jgi:cellobiose phosphorylase
MLKALAETEPFAGTGIRMATTPASSNPAATARRVENAYGYFSPDGTEFVITNPRTPRPWANVISNPRMGLAISQSGSGFTWIDNSQLAVLTRWEQDLVRDCSGKFLYVRDADTAAVWSLAPAPVWPKYDRYACRHGLGYTTFETEFAGIRAAWTLFVHADQTVELWNLELENRSDRPRRIELCAALEWCCGVNPAPRREFHKLFIETRYDSERRAVFAQNHMWEVGSPRWGHWNTDFPYVTAFSCSEPVQAAQGDKAEFLGRYGQWSDPQALHHDLWKPRFGRHEDAIAALRSTIELRRGESRRVQYCLAVGANADEVGGLLQSWSPAASNGKLASRVDAALEAVKSGWREKFQPHRIRTPEASLNHLTNDWIRYQAISGRIWGRAGYYQQSGAFGFRDQLQDSQVWLTIAPQRCREQINLHAAHQFADGSVYHWWHPLSEQGHVTKMTDDLLWLAFVTANYIRETGDYSVLADEARFIDDDSPHPLIEHVRRAFDKSFSRSSPRGLPLIGAGDWNDGLSAVGLQEKGESFWLAEFQVGLLADWAHILRESGPLRGERFTRAAHDTWAADCERRRGKLIAAINEHAWDGQWYQRATLDDGSPLGSSRNRVARIFLNAQVWAVLNDVAAPDRAATCMAAVKEHLVGSMGALLLAPAFERPMREIGYISRYAPGLRENGGVYSHAAAWAIAAAAKMRDNELVGRLLEAMNPALKDPEAYCAEPYVLPGNVDGPTSPYPGRAGWTWYTGSAQWLHRVVTQWVLGVRPEWDGLRIEPCIPPGWTHASMTRPWRGATYDIRITRDATLAPAAVRVTLDGAALPEPRLPLPTSGGRHVVEVRCR